VLSLDLLLRKVILHLGKVHLHDDIEELLLASGEFQGRGLTEEFKIVHDTRLLVCSRVLLHSDETEVHFSVSVRVYVFERNPEFLLTVLFFNCKRDQLTASLYIFHGLDALDQRVLKSSYQKNLFELQCATFGLDFLL
jgi:hypothetical protein